MARGRVWAVKGVGDKGREMEKWGGGGRGNKGTGKGGGGGKKIKGGNVRGGKMVGGVWQPKTGDKKEQTQGD